VLYLVEALFVGGREEVVLVEAKYLDRARFEPLVCVLSDKEGPVGAELRAAGVEVVALRSRTRRPSLSLLRELAGLVKSRGIDLIHAHDYKSALYGRLLSRARLPVVYSVHTDYLRPRRKHHLINRALARYTDGVIGVSTGLCQAVVRLDGMPPERVRLLPNAIDPERLEAGQDERSEVRRRFFGPDDVCVFVTVARLEADKGFCYLLEALARLHGNCRALIIGSGPEEGALRRQASLLGLEGRVVFAGTERRLGPLLKAGDAFVLPSLHEGMSVALIEAMYLGLPVVASEVGGTGSVVSHGEQGLLVPPGDAEALSRAMESIAADPDRARQMGRAGRSRVEAAFLPRHHLAALEGLYEQVLRWRGAGQGGMK
jgi:glycosyltransferase involved in cell wall biosynthesis